jgi:hypothetical protein
MTAHRKLSGILATVRPFRDWGRRLNESTELPRDLLVIGSVLANVLASDTVPSMILQGSLTELARSATSLPDQGLWDEPACKRGKSVIEAALIVDGFIGRLFGQSEFS